MENIAILTDIDFTLTLVSPNVLCMDEPLKGYVAAQPLDAIAFGLAAMGLCQAETKNGLELALQIDIFNRAAKQLPGHSYEKAAEWAQRNLPEMVPGLNPEAISVNTIKSGFDEVMAKYIPTTSSVRKPNAEFVRRADEAGIPILAVSNSGRSIVDANLTLVDIKMRKKLRWAHIVTADDVSKSKPAPDIYLEALTQLTKTRAWKPAETRVFVLEDNYRGAKAADAAKSFFSEDPKITRRHMYICGVPMNAWEAEQMKGSCNIVIPNTKDLQQGLSRAFKLFSGLTLPY